MDTTASKLTDQERTELLDWVSACQSAYHIHSTPNHRFGGLPSNLQENRDDLVEHVESILQARFDHFLDARKMVDSSATSTLLEFAEEVRRSGDTRLASMAIAVINTAKSQAMQAGGEPRPGEREKAQADADLYGTGFIVDGRRVGPHRVQVLTAPQQQAGREVVNGIDTVQVYGVKDGRETLLGSAQMPVRMKARELAREQFGHFEDGDGSDAELCFGALEQLLDFIERNTAPSSQEQQDHVIGCYQTDSFQSMRHPFAPPTGCSGGAYDPNWSNTAGKGDA